MTRHDTLEAMANVKAHCSVSAVFWAQPELVPSRGKARETATDDE